MFSSRITPIPLPLPSSPPSLIMNASLDELQWKSPEWIQAFGLRSDNVLDYFSESPFFDKTSNNHVIKMQRQFSQQDNNNNNSNTNINTSANDSSSPSQFLRIPNTVDLDQQHEFRYADPIRRDVLLRYPLHALLERELSKLRGIEYVLAAVREPDFWIIRKQNRTAPDQTEPLQDYYIIGANVYQAPTVFNIVQSRLMSAGFHLSEMLKKLHKLTQFQPAQGIQFRTPSASSQIGNTTGAGSTTATAATTTTTTGASTGGRTVEPSTGPATLGPISALPTTVGGIGSTVGTVMNTVQSGIDGGTGIIINSSSGVGGGANNGVGAGAGGGGGSGGSGLKAHGISKEMMDKLMVISIKSKPEYI